jgi:hypothetical protein
MYSFQTGNHDSIGRVASRVGVNFVNAMNALMMSLPGTTITYYGEEIGMNSLDLTFAQTKDKWGKNFLAADYKLVSRDPSRSPMQWTSKTNAGFTNATSWLPLTSSYNEYNVMVSVLRRVGHGVGDSGDQVITLRICKNFCDTIFRVSAHFTFFARINIRVSGLKLTFENVAMFA